MGPTHRGFRLFTPLVTVLALLTCSSPTAPHRRSALGCDAETFRHAALVSVSEPASGVGLDVLQKGGTAVDAAVALAFALSVTWPEAGNIGGGGFMMVAVPGEEPVCIDYRETAPAAATEDMFAADTSNLGHRYVGVPGTVRGLALAYERYGKLSWRELVEPAVQLAEEGFEVNASLADSLNDVLETSAEFAELLRVFAPPDGVHWKCGDRLRQPDLARSLRCIADEGPDAFYRGALAELVVDEMREGGGLITLEDLTCYEARLRAPIHGTFRGFDVFAPPPPSSGGVVLVEMLNILELFDLKAYGRWLPRTCHLMIETMRRAYLDRARHLGDPDFVPLPPHLLNKDYARELASTIDPERATPSEELAHDVSLAPDDAGESSSTTHFSIVDKWGMAVSNTTTLEESYGSRVVVRGGGFLLNNEMGDFNRRPGRTDRTGRIGTRPNVVAPGKRMLSSMTPVIVMRGGRVVLLTGSPGGRKIINTVLCVLVNVLEFDMDLSAAVAAPRMHQQWLPDRVQFEGASDPAHAGLVEGLRAMGHDVYEHEDPQGDAHSIGMSRDGLEAVPDRRIDGCAVGY